ncbi:hypothetical protein [Fictibacillus macauensis]|uniref:hypothetical protein n=1 Tax=Fictibacillus macauensis TaxID=245160 RepID=UPI0002E11DA9|nr:hypothetical protein [Fictibacillus macauensis]
MQRGKKEEQAGMQWIDGRSDINDIMKKDVVMRDGNQEALLTISMRMTSFKQKIWH